MKTDLPLDLLRCPLTGEQLEVHDGYLVTESGRRYGVTSSGVPMFAEAYCSEDARRQQLHYDQVAADYLTNLSYPHTQEYMAYLDKAFLDAVSGARLDTIAEICCGRGEAVQLLGRAFRRGVGVDVSLAMLESGARGGDDRVTYVQGDGTRLPLASGAFDSVFMLGGIHHVNDRARLINEVSRILKPDGMFFWREPVSDFFLWRWIRAIIYRVSPALDADTERPLLYKETVPYLERAGLDLKSWKTYGFFGFCLFMNSDVLVFNRLFRFVPGIRSITRLATHLDDFTTRFPGLRRSGLQVVGAAVKRTEKP